MSLARTSARRSPISSKSPQSRPECLINPSLARRARLPLHRTPGSFFFAASTARFAALMSPCSVSVRENSARIRSTGIRHLPARIDSTISAAFASPVVTDVAEETLLTTVWFITRVPWSRRRFSGSTDIFQTSLISNLARAALTFSQSNRTHRWGTRRTGIFRFATRHSTPRRVKCSRVASSSFVSSVSSSASSFFCVILIDAKCRLFHCERKKGPTLAMRMKMSPWSIACFRQPCFETCPSVY